MKKSIIIFMTAVATTVIFIIVSSRILKSEAPPPFYAGRHINALIQLDSLDHRGHSFRATGYHYDLLKRFASDMNATIEIHHADSRSIPLDSLMLGTADIVVYAASLAPVRDSIALSRQIDSCAVWAVKSIDPRRIEELSGWMESYIDSPADDSIRTIFMTPLRPHKLAQNGVKRGHITPYDEILKANADSIGWDWRLLAALMYQESRFNINAGSPQGARGLMQLMPRTRSYYGCSNYLDPEQNIAAGTRLLKRLEDKLDSRISNLEELEKFTLAAYNAGDGRLDQCIQYAGAHGADITNWSSVAGMIPQYSLETQTDTTQKTFNGSETVSFVNKVLSYYECFKTICPDQD